jgi:hypothetical protein
VLLLAACGVEAGAGGRALADASTSSTTSTTTAQSSSSTATTTTGSAGRGSTTTQPTAEPNDADEALSDAVASTLAVEAFRVDSAAALEFAGQSLSVTGKGSIDYRARVGEVVSETKSPTASGRVTARADGTTLWLAPEGDLAEMPSGKTWLATSIDWLADGKPFGAQNLMGVVLALEGSSGAETGSTKTIDGVETTEYTTTVNYEDALAALGPDAPTFRRALSLTSPEPPDLDITVWVGVDHVIRDFHLDILDDSAFDFGGTYDFHLRDIGEPVVEPDAPPPNEVLAGPEADRIVQQLLR